MKHRCKWQVVWQTIEGGFIVAEECRCECGARRIATNKDMSVGRTTTPGNMQGEPFSEEDVQT